MDQSFYFRRMLLCSVTLAFLFFTSSCSVEEIAPQQNLQVNDNARIESRTDLTQAVTEVRQEVADRLHVSFNNVTPCFYHSQTTQGFRYKFGINTVDGGSFYLTGIEQGVVSGTIIEDIEGF